MPDHPPIEPGPRLGRDQQVDPDDALFQEDVASGFSQAADLPFVTGRIGGPRFSPSRLLAGGNNGVRNPVALLIIKRQLSASLLQSHTQPTALLFTRLIEDGGNQTGMSRRHGSP